MLHPEDSALHEPPPEPPIGLAMLAFAAVCLGVMFLAAMSASQ